MKRKNPIDPKTGKPRRGRPPASLDQRAVLLPIPKSIPKSNPTTNPTTRPTTTTTKGSGSSTSTDRQADLAAALAELDNDGKGGDARGGPGVTPGAENCPPQDGASPPALPLTEQELVEVTELGTGLLVGVAAIFTGRQIPSEQSLAMAASTKKLLSLSAGSTLKAGAEFFVEHADDLRLVGVAAFCLTAFAHSWRKFQELKTSDPKPPPPREHNAAPAPSNGQALVRQRLEPPKSGG